MLTHTYCFKLLITLGCRDSEAGEPHNLLRTNFFLNQFVIMDDFCSKKILVLKRASPPPVRV